MMDHKICFYGMKWLIFPKLYLLHLLIWSTGSLSDESLFFRRRKEFGPRGPNSFQQELTNISVLSRNFVTVPGLLKKWGLLRKQRGHCGKVMGQ